MKSIAAVLLCLCSLKAVAKPTSVTLWKNRATVVHTRHIQREKGPTTIVFKDLSQYITIDNLKATVDQKGAKILSVSSYFHYPKKSSNETLLALKATLKKETEKRQRTLAKIKLLTKNRAMRQQLSEHYRQSFLESLHRGKWTKKEFQSFLKLLTQGPKQDRKNWEKLYQQFENGNEKMSHMRAQIKLLQSPSDRKVRYGVVNLDIQKAGSFKVSLVTSVSHVQWRPVYALRLHPKYATLEMAAVIHQNTGVDWQDVTIRLSNNNARLHVSPPKLTATTLHAREVKKVKTVIRSASVEGEVLRESTSSQDEGALYQTFTLTGRHTVKSGKEDARVRVQSKKLPFTAWSEVVSAQMDHVYRRVAVVNKTGHHLRPGVMAIYDRGRYLQKFQLPFTARGAIFDVNAGIDYDLVVKRYVHDESGDEGSIFKQKVYKRRSTTRLTNHSSRKKKLRVLEQIPISETKEISVAVTSQPKGIKKLTRFRSWHYWQAEIPAHGTQQFSLNLAVKTPTDYGFSWPRK